MVLSHSPVDPGAAPGDATGPSLRRLALDVASRIAQPTAADRDHNSRWDAHILAELTRALPTAALTGPLVPTVLGGGGLSATETLALLEGLGQGARDPGLALALGVHAVLATAPLRAFGSPRQRERYLPRMADGTWMGAVSLSQTQGTAVVQTVRVRPETAGPGGWVLTGEIDLVAAAPVAHHYLVIAEHTDGARTAFLLDRSTPGLLINAAGPAALRTCPWGRLTLDNCLLPADAVLGTVGGAVDEVEPLLAALDWVFTSAPWLGVMRALTHDAGEAAHQQRLFGQPRIHSQTTRFVLADMATQCELASGLLYRAAAEFDAGGRPSRQNAAAARLFTAAAVRVCVDSAARLSGVLALNSDDLIARAHRDALFFTESGGGPEVQRSVIAAAALGLG
ncbi:acyl-CoA dehydrogenase family protein [Streptacidiphilus neutrinimicus]|uniref:acyl-CoA dehydrogenase family protein n=1 Tax=Streptacidiphilus neutrinimicus TaxID=105420 RepID=UPI0005A7E308|nr:acyl-CoA dehydrogenase family protein [Streptacidiphilus neutrinimicus]